RVRAIKIVVALARRLTPANTVVSDVVAESPAIGVGPEELQALGGPLTHTRLKGVVGADADRVRAARRADVRVQRVERSALAPRPPRLDRTGIGDGLVEVERDDHVTGAATHVAHLAGERVRKLGL